MKKRLFILTNGPGEMICWVKPLIPYLKEQYDIWLFMLPCQFSTGREYEVASRWNGIGRLFSPINTLSFLLFGGSCKASAIIQIGGETLYGRWFKKKFGTSYILWTMATKKFKGVDYLLFPYESMRQKALTLGFDRDKVYAFGNLHLLGLRKIVREQAKKMLRWDGRTVVGILPGSRIRMFPHNFEFAWKVATDLKQKYGVEVAFLISEFLREDEIRPWREKGVQLVGADKRIEFFNACDVVIAPPGSSNFEIAYLTGKGIVVLPFEMIDNVPVQGIWHFLSNGWFKRRMLKRFIAKEKYLSWVNRMLSFTFLKEIIGYNIEDEVVSTVGDLLSDNCPVKVDTGELFKPFDVDGFINLLEKVTL